MKSFFKTMLACVVAILVSSMIYTFGVICFVGIISQFATTSPKTYDDETLLKISLNNEITENPTSNPIYEIDPFTFKVKKSMNLISVLGAIENAAIDSKISGIYMNLTSMQPMSMTTISEIRRAINKFKESGKPVICYADYYSHSSYFLASIADQIFLPPTGSLQWQGLASQSMFFKGTLDKLGIKPEIIRHGKYKSAVEPFTQEKMSPENRQQTQELISSIWGYMVNEISTSRLIDSTKLQSYATNLTIDNAQSAVETSLINGILYSSEVEEFIKEQLAISEFKTVSLEDYVDSFKQINEEYSSNKVAVIYANGEIVSSSSGAENEIVSGKISATLQKATEDDDIKAVVLRINSPGGSALAADNIWYAVKKLRSVKPVIVSMGATAASGGYYIAAPADVILAEPSTITGSIGVFGVMFNAKEGLKDKLGITLDAVTTNPSADMGSIARGLSPAERKFMQNSVEEVYDTFVAKVAEGRNLSIEQANNIAQGRVWSGIDARKVGLVDGFGGISDAISLAADRAGIASSYRLHVIKEESSPLDMVFETLMGEVKINFKGNNIIDNKYSAEFERVKRYMSGDKIVSILPYSIYFE